MLLIFRRPILSLLLLRWLRPILTNGMLLPVPEILAVLSLLT